MSFHPVQTGTLLHYTAAAFTEAGGVAHGFSTRLGGVSRGDLESLNLGRSRDDDPDCVAENHRRFAQAMGGKSGKLVLCQQIHSDIVRVVTEEDALSHLYDLDNFEADGMVTNTLGLTLAVFYADCIPVLLYDPVKRAVGAVHSGWRGTAKAISAKAVRLMREHYNSNPADILAAIGPGIGADCFETHRDVPDAMEAELGATAVRPWVTSIGGGKYLVDLKGIIAAQLRESGLSPANISVSELCTACHPEQFWSHRRLGERRGNQAAMIQLLD